MHACKPAAPARHPFDPKLPPPAPWAACAAAIGAFGHRRPAANFASPGRRAAALAGALALFTGSPVMAIDLAPLWDFSRPDVSEQRFRQALEHASGDDALVLQTQVARTHGLRKDFEAARALLRTIAPQVAAAGPQARVRYHLEWGRSFASAAHAPDQLTPDARAQARQAYQAALDIARAAGLDALAIDAVHMFAFVDTAPADQLRWGELALEIVQQSSQPDARRWEASIRNNLGLALHGLGRDDEALAQFRQAVALREAGANAEATRAAHWMVAWTLRSLNRAGEALAIQLRLAQEADAAGQPDPYVFEELEVLYAGRGDAARAAHYAERRRALARP